MAKRKRLTPARPDYLQEAGSASEAEVAFPAVVATRSPPIAQVAGATATTAALNELAEELRSARVDGRLVQTLPLEAIDETYLVRDRMVADDTEMSALVESLRTRGQQTPIEVVELDEGRYGLISGWRRLTALRKLRDETGDEQFQTVLALLRRPESASDAYLAMVEENEIRVGLSYYERARIIARAAQLGVYPDEGAALRGLFASASRAKRSKIGSFLTLYHALDDQLRFATAIPERLGLALAKALKEDPAAAHRVADVLRSHPAESADQEMAALAGALKSGPVEKSASSKARPGFSSPETIGNIHLACSGDGRQLLLSGPGISGEFLAGLREWLRDQK